MSRNIIYHKYKPSSATSSGICENVVVEKILTNPLLHHRNLAANQQTKVTFSTWFTDLIGQIGLLHPVVKSEEDYFELIAGSKNLAACKSLGWLRIPCHITIQSDREAYETSLVENIQRKNLEPIEEAYSFIKYIIEFGRSRVGHGVAPARTTAA